MLTNKISNELKKVVPENRIIFEEEFRHKYSQDAFCTYDVDSLADEYKKISNEQIIHVALDMMKGTTADYYRCKNCTKQCYR